MKTRQQLQQQFDTVAIHQLRAEIQTLAQTQEKLEQELYLTEQSAEGWRQDFMDLQLQLCADGTHQAALAITGQHSVTPTKKAKGS